MCECAAAVKSCVTAATSEGDEDVEDTGDGSLHLPDWVLGFDL